jgi:cell division protein FtsL
MRQEYRKREGVMVYMLDHDQRQLYKLREREVAEAKKRAAAWDKASMDCTAWCAIIWEKIR